MPATFRDPGIEYAEMLARHQATPATQPTDAEKLLALLDRIELDVELLHVQARDALLLPVQVVQEARRIAESVRQEPDTAELDAGQIVGMRCHAVDELLKSAKLARSDPGVSRRIGSVSPIIQ